MPSVNAVTIFKTETEIAFKKKVIEIAILFKQTILIISRQ